MTRKLTLLLLPLLVVLAACDISSVPWVGTRGEQFHWKRTEAVATLNVVIDPSANALRPLIQKSMADWSRAKYVDLRLSYMDVCWPGSSCIYVKGKVMNGGTAGPATYADGHIAWASMTIDNRAPIDNQRQGVICHEFGHTLGLNHPPAPRQGPCRNGVPTAWDLAVVDAIHDHRHAS